MFDHADLRRASIVICRLCLVGLWIASLAGLPSGSGWAATDWGEHLVPALSKTEADPLLQDKPAMCQTVYVTSSAHDGCRAKSLAGAVAKVQSGGTIRIAERKALISEDGKPLIITRALNIDLDAALLTALNLDDQHPPEVTMQAGKDGSCFSVKVPSRSMVSVRNVRFVPGTASAKGCLTVEKGTLVLNNVNIAAGEHGRFDEGIRLKHNDTEVKITSDFRMEVSRIGIAVEGGVLIIDATSRSKISGLAPSKQSSAGDYCDSAFQEKQSIGLYVGSSRSRFFKEPAAHVKGVTFSGFNYGICAAGNGASINGATIKNAGIGIRAEGGSAFQKVKIRNSDVSGLIIGGEGGSFTNNRIYNGKAAGVSVGGTAASFTQNRIALNDTGIVALSASGSFAKQIENFSGNEVSCNRRGGDACSIRAFQHKPNANLCRKNAPSRQAGSYCATMASR